MPLYVEDMSSECVVCGKSVTYNFALCSPCIEKYGYYVDDWEEWLRFLWNDKQRSRRDSIEARKREFSLEEYFEKNRTKEYDYSDQGAK